jgi:cytochrome c553
VRRLVLAGAVLLACVTAGLVVVLVAASGVVRLQASAGHWSLTKGFLEFVSRRSIATWSSGIEAPPLDDPRLVVQGAAHFEAGCRPCHGAPGERPPAFGASLVPSPPQLERAGATWRDAELFYVVLHGVKYTGMLPWPVEGREDEVWPVVAFLRAFPTLDARGYAALVDAVEAEDVPDEIRPCVRCHGADGLGRGVFPRLAGQRAAYLESALRAYVAEDRPSGVMRVALDGVDEGRFEALARTWSELPAGPAWVTTDVEAVARGEAIATGVAGTPACVQCHGPGPAPTHASSG